MYTKQFAARSRFLQQHIDLIRTIHTNYTVPYGKTTRLDWQRAFNDHPDWATTLAVHRPPTEDETRQLSNFSRYHVTGKAKEYSAKSYAKRIAKKVARKYNKTFAKMAAKPEVRFTLGNTIPALPVDLPQPAEPHPVNKWAVEAPVSFCPVCGSDLRDCRAKARVQ